MERRGAIILTVPDEIRELDTVRIAKLNEGSRPVIGSGVHQRQPKLGDVGAVVAIMGDGESYTVECVSEGGMTDWLCDFDRDELEMISTT